MKRVCLVSPDPNFFENREHAINRRGAMAYPVFDLVDAAETMIRVPMDLIIVDARALDALQLHEDVNAIVATVQMPLILVVPGKDEDQLRKAFRDIPQVFLVPHPSSSKYLVDLSSKLLAVANRKYVRVLVQVRVAGEKQSQTRFAFSRNISESGMLLETEAVFQVDDVVGLNFMLPGAAGGTPIEARGQIVRVQDKDAGSTVNLYGLQFLDIGASERERIGAYVR